MPGADHMARRARQHAGEIAQRHFAPTQAQVGLHRQAAVRLRWHRRFHDDVLVNGKIDPEFTNPVLAKSVWAEIVKAAEDNYKPGKFTTFAGFEWTSNPQKRNLHRVEVVSDSASFSMEIQNIPSANPKTGRITAQSVIAALRKLTGPLRVGT